jgi:hypothetical protein
MSLSNWEIDISRNALLPLEISHERMDVIFRDDSDYLNRAAATSASWSGPRGVSDDIHDIVLVAEPL